MELICSTMSFLQPFARNSSRSCKGAAPDAGGTSVLQTAQLNSSHRQHPQLLGQVSLPSAGAAAKPTDAFKAGPTARQMRQLSPAAAWPAWHVTCWSYGPSHFL